MSLLAQGDRDALSALYDKYSGVLLALCQRILHDLTEAEQLLLDVFTELWLKAERYDRDRGAPLTYLITLCRSRAIDRCRSRRNKHGKWILGGNPAENVLSTLQAPSDPPADAMVAGEQGQAVRRALNALNNVQRQVLELAYYGGLSHSEIAENTQLPLGTVKSHIRLALIRLRQELRTMQ